MSEVVLAQQCESRQGRPRGLATKSRAGVATGLHNPELMAECRCGVECAGAWSKDRHAVVTMLRNAGRGILAGPNLPSAPSHDQRTKGRHMNQPRKCGCGKDAIEGLWHCRACRERIATDYASLQETLQKGHRGAGGAAMCICGASCGGTAACSALSILRIALTTTDKLLRDSILDAIGWDY